MVRPTRQSITEKRKQDAERQARRRARLRAEGVPQTHEMERVMLEAFSYSWHKLEIELGRQQMPAEVVDLRKEMIFFALKLLTERHGYGRTKALFAVHRAIRPRPGHMRGVNRQ